MGRVISNYNISSSFSLKPVPGVQIAIPARRLQSTVAVFGGFAVLELEQQSTRCLEKPLVMFDFPFSQLWR